MVYMLMPYGFPSFRCPRAIALLRLFIYLFIKNMIFLKNKIHNDFEIIINDETKTNVSIIIM